MGSLAFGEDVSHQAISAYFIGPRAENLSDFRSNITALLDEVQRAREEYFGDDVVGPVVLPHNPHLTLCARPGKWLRVHPAERARLGCVQGCHSPGCQSRAADSQDARAVLDPVLVTTVPGSHDP